MQKWFENALCMYETTGNSSKLSIRQPDGFIETQKFDQKQKKSSHQIAVLCNWMQQKYAISHSTDGLRTQNTVPSSV